MTNIWLKMYELAKKYYEEFDNLLVPFDYAVKENNETFYLGAWISAQRRYYKRKMKSKLTEEQITMLEKIGMVWDVKEYELKNLPKKIPDDWLKMYELTKRYYEEHGNLLISKNYSIICENKAINLDSWLKEQRRNYENAMLLDKQIRLLEDIDMIWDLKSYRLENKSKGIREKWLKVYGLAKTYYKKYGNLIVPRSYKIIIDERTVNLGEWIRYHREKYSNSMLSHEKIMLLEKIGMVWNVLEYKELDKYLEQQYILYKQGMLNEQQITKLLNEGVLVYSDLDKGTKLQRANTLELYKKSCSK